MQDAKRALEATLDAGELRRSHMTAVAQLLDAFSSLMAGGGAIDMHTYGLTSDEECGAHAATVAASEDRWPLLADMELDGEYFPAGAGVFCRLGCWP